jgi:hypothetical protein
LILAPNPLQHCSESLPQEPKIIAATRTHRPGLRSHSPALSAPRTWCSLKFLPSTQKPVDGTLCPWTYSDPAWPTHVPYVLKPPLSARKLLPGVLCPHTTKALPTGHMIPFAQKPQHSVLCTGTPPGAQKLPCGAPTHYIWCIDYKIQINP